MQHEGRRVFAEGRGLGPSLAWLTGSFAFAGVFLAVIRDVEPLVVAVITLVSWAFFVVLALLHARGRVRITPSEVRIRGALGERVVPRHEIAEVVHTDNLQVMGTNGYLALLDDRGEPLWRTSTKVWPEATLVELRSTGRRRTHLKSLSPQEARERWPRMLPVSLAYPLWAFSITFVTILLVAGGIVALAVVLER